MADAENEENVRLIAQLGSLSARVRNGAIEALVECGGPAVEPLLKTYYDSSWQPARNAARHLVLLLLPQIFLIAPIKMCIDGMVHAPNAFAGTVMIRMFDEIAAVWVAPLIALWVLLIILDTYCEIRSIRRLGGICTVAARLGLPSFANQLTSSLRALSNKSIKPERLDLIRSGLTRALTDMGPADATLLSRKSRKLLIRWLSKHGERAVDSPHAEDAGLCVAILQGLSTMGETELRSTAERIAISVPLTRDGQRVVEAAQRAAERLNKRASQIPSGDLPARMGRVPAEASIDLLPEGDNAGCLTGTAPRNDEAAQDVCSVHSA